MVVKKFLPNVESVCEGVAFENHSLTFAFSLIYVLLLKDRYVAAFCQPHVHVAQLTLCE